MADAYLLEDGSGHFLLEDGSGILLLNTEGPPTEFLPTEVTNGSNFSIVGGGTAVQAIDDGYGVYNGADYIQHFTSSGSGVFETEWFLGFGPLPAGKVPSPDGPVKIALFFSNIALGSGPPSTFLVEFYHGFGGWMALGPYTSADIGVLCETTLDATQVATFFEGFTDWAASWDDLTIHMILTQNNALIAGNSNVQLAGAALKVQLVDLVAPTVTITEDTLAGKVRIDASASVTYGDINVYRDGVWLDPDDVDLDFIAIGVYDDKTVNPDLQYDYTVTHTFMGQESAPSAAQTGSCLPELLFTNTAAVAQVGYVATAVGAQPHEVDGTEVFRVYRDGVYLATLPNVPLSRIYEDHATNDGESYDYHFDRLARGNIATSTPAITVVANGGDGEGAVRFAAFGIPL